ncbi:MAG: MBL fold metallo-hydrolase [Acidimicrobiia bacterium]
MKLRVLGSNGTYPTPGRPASGYLIEHEGVRVWLDAGSGTFVALQEVLPAVDVDALVISHIHPDHCADIFPLFNLFRYGPDPRSGFPVLVPEGAADHLATFARAGDNHSFFEIFDFRTVGSGEEASLGAIRLTFGRADHSVPTIVTRAETAGRSLTYSADTGTAGDLPDLAAGATVLLCEASYQGPGEEKPWPYHLTASEAGAIAREALAGRLVLTHLMPALDPSRSLAEAEAAFGRPTEHAVPGAEVTV